MYHIKVCFYLEISLKDEIEFKCEDDLIEKWNYPKNFLQYPLKIDQKQVENPYF